MRKFFLAIFLIIVFAGLSHAAEVEKKYGSLKIYSKIGYLSVYVDNQFVGETPVEIERVQAGTHFVSISSKEVAVYEEVVTIKEGEVTTIIVPKEKLAPSPTPEAKVAPKVLKDFSEVIFSGPYVAIGFGSSVHVPTYYYISEYFEGTALNFGAGYKFGLAPHIDLTLNIERGDYSGNGKNWYVMPISLNIFLAYQNPYYVGGKVFYGLGYGLCLTNFKYKDEDASANGWSLTYGFEFPSGDKNSVFFQNTFSQAKNNSLDYNFLTYNFMIGYRWWM